MDEVVTMESIDGTLSYRILMQDIGDGRIQAVAAPLTEVMLLGIVALRAGQSRRILYDGAKMEITNAPEANQYLTREYRSGWTL